MAGLVLAVVDRHVEVERLIRISELNHSEVLDKPFLLYSSQMFGSGKTTFGSNALTLLQDPAVKHNLIHPPPPDTSLPEDLVRMRNEQKFTTELVDSYINARTVIVDLKYISKPKPGEGDFLFQHALYYAIYCAAVKPVDREVFFSKLKGVDHFNLMQLIVEETNFKGKWLFFIDEMGFIEGITNLFPDLNNPLKFISSKANHVDGYTLLFDLLLPFLVRKDSFVFCAGKSAKLTQKSLEESGSPVRLRLRLLALPSLQPQHISEILCKTTHKGQTLKQILGVSDVQLPILAEIIFHFTGGIPRLVSRTFESLLSRNAPIPVTKDEIVQVMSGKVRDDIVVDVSSFFRPEYMSDYQQEFYTTLLMLSLFHIKIKKSTVVRIGPEGTKFVLDWVSILCLYITPDGPDTYKLVFSQFLIDYLQKYPPSGENRIVLLASLLEQLSNLPGVIDQGRILEVLLAQSLAFQIAFVDTFGEIPGLQRTILHDIVVPKNIGRGFTARFLPLFQPKTKEGAPHLEVGVIKSYNPADWDLFFLQLLKDDLMNVVGIVREQNSNGPDLVLPIQTTDLATPNTLPDRFFTLGFASKNLQRKNTTSWIDIVEEIEKGLNTPLKNVALKGKLRAVLIIASTQLVTELEDVIDDGQLSIVCGPGTWYHHKQSKKLEQGKSMRGWEEKFTVPPNGELVILSKSGMNALLGDGTLATLATYFERAEDDRCECLLSMEQALGNLARKRKREDVPVETPPQGRTIKLLFVDSATKAVISKGMTSLPFKTILSAAHDTIGVVLNKKVPGRTVVGLEWEGVVIEDDDDIDSVGHRDEVVVLVK